MPHSLKTGLEALSGMDLSGVRVHNNSSKPAQVNALAYTQGQDIHVGPGQERHLAHEGWHAVQQMQGRVKPTVQAKGGSINDDEELEREADVMGAEALQMTRAEQVATGMAHRVSTSLQRKGESKAESNPPGEVVGTLEQKVGLNFLYPDAPALEREADLMGERAARAPVHQRLCAECEQEAADKPLAQARAATGPEREGPIQRQPQTQESRDVLECAVPPESAPAPARFVATLPAGSRDYSPAPGEETLVFEGLTLSTDADHTRAQLEELVRLHGRDALYSFPSRFEQRMVLRVMEERDRKSAELSRELETERDREQEHRNLPRGFPGGMPWSADQFADREAEIERLNTGTEEELLSLPRSISAQLWMQARSINGEIASLFAHFSQRSDLIIRTLLDESERRVLAEQERYGIRGSHVYHSYRSYDPELMAGLVGAAKDLHAHRQQIASITAQRQSLVRRSPFNRQTGETYEWIEDQDRHDELGARLTEATKRYSVARAGAETRYPILAAFAPGSSVGDLDDIASDENPQWRTVLLGTEIGHRLDSIREVREGLGGDVDPWKLKEIAALTMADMGVRPDTMYARLLGDEISRRSETSTFEWILIGLAVVLGVVGAAFTGGGSLALAVGALSALGSVGISGYLLAEHLSEYETESALATTDFDRARSIAAEDPSAFWLALDIAFFVVDLGAAAKAFAKLAPLATRALGTGEDVIRGAAELRQAADAIHPGLGARVMDNLRRLRGGGDEALEVAGAIGPREAEALLGAGRDLPPEVVDQLRRIGPVSESTLTMFRDNPQLMKALADNPLAARFLKHCHSPCFPANMLDEQVKYLEDFLEELMERGMDLQTLGFREGELRGLIEAATEDEIWEIVLGLERKLGAAEELASSRMAGGPFGALTETADELGEGLDAIESAFMATRQGAHDVGVSHGRRFAMDSLGLHPWSWVNPFENLRSRFGVGIDDVMVDGAGNLWIVEYKGGTATLAGDQMQRSWVLRKISQLRSQGGELGELMADELETARRTGRLRGVTISTTIDGRTPAAARVVDPPHTY